MFRRYADNRFDPNCCFSIYHGERVKSLDLVTTNAEEARTWVTGLKYLMAGISDEDSLARRQRTRDQYPLSSLCCTNTLKNILSRSCFSPCYEIKGVFVQAEHGQRNLWRRLWHQIIAHANSVPSLIIYYNIAHWGCSALTAASHGCSRRSLRLTKTETAPWASGRFTSCSTNSTSICPSRKSGRCSK